MNSELPQQPKPTLARNLAIASAAAPVLMCLVGGFFKKMIGAFGFDLIALSLLLPGLGFGIAALVLRRGQKGVLAPALFGVIVSSLLLVIFVTNYRAAKARIELQEGR